MTDVAYYLSFVFNALIASAVYFGIRKAVQHNRIKRENAKIIYSVSVLVGGALSGLVLFHAFVAIFRLMGLTANYGHGEVIVAAVLFNLLLSLLLLIAGRILLGWQSFRW